MQLMFVRMEKWVRRRVHAFLGLTTYLVQYFRIYTLHSEDRNDYSLHYCWRVRECWSEPRE